LLGRVRVACKFPGVPARMQPSDFLAPFSRGFGSPRRRPTPMQELILGRPRMPLRTRDASETGHRLSAAPDSFEERRGPPRFLGRPLHACRGVTPRRNRSLLAPTSLRENPRRDHHRLRAKKRTLGIRNGIAFEAMVPRPTCSRAYASPAPLPRPSQGSLPARAGSPLARRDSHPLDGESKFHGVIAVLQSQSTSRAWSHSSYYPPLCSDVGRSVHRRAAAVLSAMGSVPVHHGDYGCVFPTQGEVRLLE